MSLFSRRSMIVVAGCALTLPLAAGTANAALPDTGDLEGDLSGEVSPDGASAGGSTSAGGEDLGGSAGASTDRGSLQVDTPLGNGSANVETESFDIYVR